MNDSELIQLSKDQDDYTYYLSNLSQLEQSWTDDQSCWPGTLMYILIFVLGLVGNGVVFVRLLFGGRHTFFLHKSTATLLASLVSADLVFLAVCVPHEVGLRMTLPWTGSRGVCKLFGFAEMLAAASSVINLAAISSERYVVIVHPMKARMLCTMQNTRKVIIVSWVVSAILSSPLIFITDLKTHLFYNNVTSIRTFICASNHFVSPSFEYVFGWYQLLILFVVPVAVLSFCYITVATVLWRSTKRFGTMTNQSYKFKSSNCNDNHLSDISEISTHRRSVHISLTSSNVTSSSNQDNVIKSRKKVVKMLVAIVVAFYLCWGPRMVLTLVVKYVPHIFHTDLFFDFQVYIRLLPYLHSCINPIIYVAMNKNFRTSVSNFCSKTSSICSVSRHFKGAQTRGSTARSCCSCGRRDDEGSVKQESPGWWSENRPQSGLVGEGVSKKRAAGGKFFQMNEFRSSTNLSPTRKIPESPERGHYTAATCLSHS